ncbi:TonB-dependent receptor [Novosphingobium sp. FSY-8]|uniref:TonB-dependent receptor n=1 Tax=Novosphingobium ovatum TaxID=1908523 RepID=A0ABW9X987_9SPHN|nr:TonB-dependent receptor [Novosphingobium ovatum]NBC35101.1 TonB-dependent receptor [Novosphingobium ovatum]
MFSIRNRLTAVPCASLIALAASLSGTSLAHAAEQDSAAPAAAPTRPAEPTAPDIVVTGSRIARAGFTAPTPVTVMGAEQLTKAAPSTLAESLRQLPSLTNTSGPQRNSGSSRVGQSFLNLRSLGPTRTLTLFDGRRMVSSSLTGSVDANILPSAVVQRVEVVTGGASAAYGSDAVAGVVNFILDKKFTGLKGEINYGLAQEGDNREIRATLSAGLKFAEGRGHILVSGEYFRNDGVAPSARPWASQGWGLINNPSGTPTLVLKPNVLTVGTYGGLIIGGNGGTAANNALFKGIQFMPGGVAAAYNYGTYTTSTQQVGGDGVPTENIQEINRPLERGSGYVHVGFDVSDALSLYADAMYGRSSSTVNNTYNRRQTANPFTIQRDNAFLPDAIRNQMQAVGVTSLTMLRFSRERGFIVTRGDSDTMQGTIGAKGTIAGLSWNAYYLRGRTYQTNATMNDEITARFNSAIDAVVSPSTGQIVCRSSLTNPTNGCVPFNVFGEGSPSNAALDYTRGVSWSHATIDADVGSFAVSGPLANGWAGPIRFAIGGEYRSEKVNVTTDALSPTGAFLLGNPNPWSGRYNVKEGFVEIIAPLAKDLPLIRELELNAAGRVTDYSTSGTVKTWKLGLSYKPFDDLRLRGTRSRDIRAPNLSELYQAGRQSIASVNDPFKSNVRVTGILQNNSGNAGLKPEIADTLTFGAVYSPSWVPHLNLSVDFYDISIASAIDNIAAQTAVDQCYVGTAAACALFTRDTAGNITSFSALPINLASAKTRGIDFEVGYSAPNGLLGLKGNVTLRAVATYLAKQETTTPGGAPIDRAGEAGVNPYPRWRGVAQFNYQGETVGGFLQARYVGGGAYDVTRGPAVVDLQNVSAQVYFDGQISFKPKMSGSEIELFLNVRNILDNAPPIAPENANVPVAFNAFLHDVIGRTFRVGARFKY